MRGITPPSATFLARESCEPLKKYTILKYYVQEKNKPYLRWVNEDKTILAEMEPRGHGGTYSVFIAFYPHDWFLKKARGK